MKPTQKTQLALPPPLHKKAKVKAIELGITLNEVMTRALSGYLAAGAPVPSIGESTTTKPAARKRGTTLRKGERV